MKISIELIDYSGRTICNCALSPRGLCSIDPRIVRLQVDKGEDSRTFLAHMLREDIESEKVKELLEVIYETPERGERIQRIFNRLPLDERLHIRRYVCRGYLKELFKGV